MPAPLRPAKPKPDPLLALAESLDGCAKALDRIANAIDRLGNGDAATTMGAVEALGFVLKESLTEAGSSIAEAIREAHTAEE